jgi:hypothetical protein
MLHKNRDLILIYDSLHKTEVPWPRAGAAAGAQGLILLHIA